MLLRCESRRFQGKVLSCASANVSDPNASRDFFAGRGYCLSKDQRI